LVFSCTTWVNGGGGDAKILSAIGFLVPVLPPGISVNLIFPFPIGFFFNVFLVGAFYMIVYAIVLTFMNSYHVVVFLSRGKCQGEMPGKNEDHQFY
jgi:hypothetical protein